MLCRVRESIYSRAPKKAIAWEDDSAANDAYLKMREEAMSVAEKKHKDRPANT